MRCKERCYQSPQFSYIYIPDTYIKDGDTPFGKYRDERSIERDPRQKQQPTQFQYRDKRHRAAGHRGGVS